MAVIAYVIIGLLALAVIAWVYFDAVELGKPAIAWAIAQPVLFWLFFLPLVLYAIFREQGQRRATPPGGARRQATYIASFVGYSAIAYGVAALISTLVVGLSTDLSGDLVSELVSSSVALIAVGGVLWGLAWIPAAGRLQAIGDDAEYRATFYLHRAYVYTVIGTAVVVLTVSGLWVVTGLTMSLAGEEDIDVEAWTWAVGPLLTAAVSLSLHYGLYLSGPRYREFSERFESILPLPMVGGGHPAAPALVGAAVLAGAPVAGGPRFCRSCGTELRSGDAFCAHCGAAV